MRKLLELNNFTQPFVLRKLRRYYKWNCHEVGRVNSCRKGRERFHNSVGRSSLIRSGGNSAINFIAMLNDFETV